MKRYIIYKRVSDVKQKDRIVQDVEEEGLGLQAQEHMCREWIKKNNPNDEPYEILVFKDIVTGTDKKRKELEERPNLLEAISLLEEGDTLLVAKRDRLGRDTYVNCMIERLIEKRKAVLVSACGDIGGDEPHSILMRRIMDAFAEYEALLISTRTRAALSRKKAKGERLGHVPYGYKLDGNQNLIVNHEEAKILRVMYQMRVEKKMSFRDIANTLNSQGYRNRGTAKNLDAPWNHGSTSRVYKNYPGVCDHVFSAHPSSVSQDVLVPVLA